MYLNTLMKDNNTQNYIIIALTLIIIGIYSYFSEEKRELEDTIYKQHQAIQSQNKLIGIYQYYYDRGQSHNQNNPFPYDSRRTIKMPSTQKSI